MAKKFRADMLVAIQGLAASQEEAARCIMAGKVLVAVSPEQGKIVQKPGDQYPEGVVFSFTGMERFVSRGAYKLLSAIEHFSLDVSNLVCLDAGASTGGFTDCLLQHGAKKVYAVDVGKAQLHERLQADDRVISLEGINLRTAPESLIPEPVDLLVADVSFISLTLVLPHCMRWLASSAMVVALIKPQFEVGSKHTEKGIVRDPGMRQAAMDKVVGFCSDTLGLVFQGIVPAAIKGPKGNQEYLALFHKSQTASDMGEISAVTADKSKMETISDERII